MARSELEAKVPQIENQWYDGWIKDNIPEGMLKGKVAVVTGSNSGTGFWCASALAGQGGATVVLACRSTDRAVHAKEEILARYPGARLDVIPLDNSDLSSVKEFADAFLRKYETCDYLVNNAGIACVPYELTKDEQEVQFQTNHLGHFLLTKLLFTTMAYSPGQARIVNHSSGAHKLGSPYFDPARMEYPTHGAMGWMIRLAWWPVLSYYFGDYWAGLRYCVSKLCNVLFTRGLEKRINDAELSERIIAVACHPGFASTGLQARAEEAGNWTLSFNKYAQSAADGSLPLLMACVGPDVENGDYLGPEKSSTGPPTRDVVGGYGNDAQQAKDLWVYSETAVGPKFKFDISNPDLPRTADRAIDKLAEGL